MVPIVVQLREARRQRESLGYIRGGAMSVGGPQGLPLTKPPYSRVTAIDLNTGEHEWVIPHGEGPRQQIIEMRAVVLAAANAHPDLFLGRTGMVACPQDCVASKATWIQGRMLQQFLRTVGSSRPRSCRLSTTPAPVWTTWKAMVLRLLPTTSAQDICFMCCRRSAPADRRPTKCGVIH